MAYKMKKKNLFQGLTDSELCTTSHKFAQLHVQLCAKCCCTQLGHLTDSAAIVFFCLIRDTEQGGLSSVTMSLAMAGDLEQEGRWLNATIPVLATAFQLRKADDCV